jgi:hypothetical protein
MCIRNLKKMLHPQMLRISQCANPLTLRGAI